MKICNLYNIHVVAILLLLLVIMRSVGVLTDDWAVAVCAGDSWIGKLIISE